MRQIDLIKQVTKGQRLVRQESTSEGKAHWPGAGVSIWSGRSPPRREKPHWPGARVSAGGGLVVRLSLTHLFTHSFVQQASVGAEDRARCCRGALLSPSGGTAVTPTCAYQDSEPEPQSTFWDKQLPLLTGGCLLGEAL